MLRCFIFLHKHTPQKGGDKNYYTEKSMFKSTNVCQRKRKYMSRNPFGVPASFPYPSVKFTWNILYFNYEGQSFSKCTYDRNPFPQDATDIKVLLNTHLTKKKFCCCWNKELLLLIKFQYLSWHNSYITVTSAPFPCPPQLVHCNYSINLISPFCQNIPRFFSRASSVFHLQTFRTLWNFDPSKPLQSLFKVS